MTSQVRRETRLIEEEDGGWSVIDTRVGMASGGDTREEASVVLLDEILCRFEDGRNAPDEASIGSSATSNR